MLKRRVQPLPVRVTSPIRESLFETMLKPETFFGLNWPEEMFNLPSLARGNAALVPEVDMFETDAELIIKSPLPGIEAKDINVECTENALSISGEFKKDEEAKDIGYYRREVAFGQFQRRLPLPVEIKPDEVKAQYERGVLEIHLPKVKNGKKNAVQQVPVEAKK